MGGIGSGTWYRWDKKTTLEETKRIDIRYMKKQGFLKPGYLGTLHWHCGNQETGYIQFLTHEDHLTLNYRYREYGDDWESLNYSVYFDRTHCHYGNARKWFKCPNLRCNKRVAVLYNCGKYFLCRHCVKLPYGSQQECKIERMIRAKNKLEDRIFEPGDYQIKRKGMHWKTYEPLLRKYRELDIMSDMAIEDKFERYLFNDSK